VDFALSTDQRALKEKFARFGSTLNQGLAERDASQFFDTAGWRRCAEFGVHALPIETDYGGRQADGLSVALALEGLGYGCKDHGLCFSLNAHLWGCALPIQIFGSAAQKRRFLPQLANGEWIGALAVSEAQAGSDAYGMTATAERRGDDYVLNGQKLYVTNGPLADVVVVLATLDPRKGAHGISAFIVEPGFAGFIRGAPIDKLGLRTATMGNIEFHDCHVPGENRLGPEGVGPSLFNQAMDWERAFILASSVGSMQRQIERSLDRVKTRRQFGKAIGHFQEISTKIVAMHGRLETARLLLYRLAWLKSAGNGTSADAALVKLHISESWVQSCQDALQIHGAEGYLGNSDEARDLRDALASRLYSGTSEIQRQIIGHWLGLG
jgi:alkylation response protein AidB-like acyl-CoA dehydrogenase